jgi:KaiC/GvpD/RAD55 family RecA-like ATPase
MLKNAITGLENLLMNEVPAGFVILVNGAEGTLKSGVVFNMLSNHIAASGEHGLYITLEQTKESHLLNMDSLGIKKNDSLHIFDYHDMREEWIDREMDFINMTEEVIDFYKDKYGNLTVFALDSLNAFYSISEDAQIRNKMYHFFLSLREKGLTSFLIMESPHARVAEQIAGQHAGHQPERFLADGTIELGMIEGNGVVKRYIQILKMRATRHAMEKHQLVIDENGLNILGPIY